MSELPRPQPDSDDIDATKIGESTSAPGLPACGENDHTRPWPPWFDEVSEGLRSFLRHRLRQESDVDDCLQVVFIKMLESMEEVAPAARRAWMFRVAANEAAQTWRREAARNRLLQQHGGETAQGGVSGDPIDRVILTETTQQLEQSLRRLPPDWQEIVRLRIHQNLTFQQIADQLGIPLGTALTRMRRALERLKNDMNQDTK